MTAFVLGFSISIGWVVVLMVFWIIRKAFTTSLDLGD